MATNDERGFTLVEVLVAMVVLTIALVSMAELMAVTLRMQMRGRTTTSAIRLAQSKIDELVARDFDTNAAVAIGGSLTADVAGYFDDPVDSGFKRRWQIEAIAGETRVRTLTVRMIPDVGARRISEEVDLVTIIRDP